jgi:CRP/FNR family transcriptional regulator, cyclic AMP receptor protein
VGHALKDMDEPLIKGIFMNDMIKTQKILVCKKNDFLFKQNDRSRDLYIIKTGKVRVFKVEGGIDIELDVVGPGGIVGEIAIIDGGPRSASVVALEDTEAFMITDDDFKNLSSRIPDWFQKIATILAHRLREADARIDRNMESDKTAHVAAALSLITYSTMGKTLDEGKYEIAAKTLENEVMDMLNIKYSDVIAAFEKLSKQDILRIEKGKTVIAGREKLDELSKTVFKTAPNLPAT